MNKSVMAFLLALLLLASPAFAQDLEQKNEPVKVLQVYLVDEFEGIQVIQRRDGSRWRCPVTTLQTGRIVSDTAPSMVNSTAMDKRCQRLHGPTTWFMKVNEYRAVAVQLEPLGVPPVEVETVTPPK